MTKQRSPEGGIDDARSLQLLERLLEGDLGVQDLARELDVSVRDLGRWMIEPDNAHVVDGLLRLADVRTQMVLCRYRAAAAAILIKIASSHEDKPGDLVRRACVDLLTIEAGAATRSRTGDRNAASSGKRAVSSAAALQGPIVHPPTEEAILRALEDLTASENESNGGSGTGNDSDRSALES